MKLASIFTDHMVFQRGLPIRVFGEGAGSVTVSFLEKSVSGDFDGKDW